MIYKTETTVVMDPEVVVFLKNLDQDSAGHFTVHETASLHNDKLTLIRKLRGLMFSVMDYLKQVLSPLNEFSHLFEKNRKIKMATW